LGSDQAKSVLFRDLFATGGCYLALQPHFRYRDGRHKDRMALEASITPLRRQDGVLCSEPEFQFHLLDKAITADPRSTRTTDHLVLARTAGRLHSDNFPSSFGEGIPNSLRQLTSRMKNSAVSRQRISWMIAS
jgi:hypothetical protein